MAEEELDAAGIDESEPNGPRLSFTRANRITPTKPEWHWRLWLCRSALHLLVGRQGGGKSTLAAWLVALATLGVPFPGDETESQPLVCAWLSLEEADDRIVARLQAAGADVDRVLVVGQVTDVDDEGRTFTRPWRLPKDCGVLEALLREQRVDLLVVDGLGYSVVGDSHNYAVIGQALSALAGVADRTGCSIVGLTHPAKGASDPVTAAIGSTAWTAVARLVWLLGVDPNDELEQRRVVRISKSNFKLPQYGLAFTIGDDERYECGYVTGLSSSEVTAEALAAGAVPAEERSRAQEAVEFIRATLADGPIETGELKRRGSAAGFSERTLERARRSLGVRASARRDPGTGRLDQWVVELPHSATPPSTPPDPLTGGVGGVGGVVVNSNSPEGVDPSPPSPPSTPRQATLDEEAF